MQERPDMSGAVEILRGVEQLVSFGWCQGTDACDAAGRPVQPWSPEATSWSLLGALVAQTEPARLETGQLTIGDLRRALAALAVAIPSDSLTDWNDASARTAAEVMEAIGAALGRLDGRIT